MADNMAMSPKLGLTPEEFRLSNIEIALRHLEGDAVQSFSPLQYEQWENVKSIFLTVFAVPKEEAV